MTKRIGYARVSTICSGPGPGSKSPPKPRASTFVVGGITALFMILGAFSGGLGGALVFLAISAAVTGLHVLATGRHSWAWLPAKRKAGAIALAVSFALFIAGAVALPSPKTQPDQQELIRVSLSMN